MQVLLHHNVCLILLFPQCYFFIVSDSPNYDIAGMRNSNTALRPNVQFISMHIIFATAIVHKFDKHLQSRQCGLYPFAYTGHFDFDVIALCVLVGFCFLIAPVHMQTKSKHHSVGSRTACREITCDISQPINAISYPMLPN